MTTPSGRSTARTSDRDTTAIQKASLATGALFLLVGIAGFIPGVTTEYDQMQFAGPDSEAMLLGIFQVSILHNIVHLAFGVLGLVAAKTIDASKIYLIGGGLVYLVLFLYGLFVEQDDSANFVPLNTADDWLHLGLGVAMIALGVALMPRRDRAVR